MQPYQFAFHDRVSSTPPSLNIWDKVVEGNLNREDKDDIFHRLQGNSGNSRYKLGGWVFPFGQYMKTYLVKYEHSGWQEIQAFDKTCIRSSFYTNSCITKIVELKD